MTDWVLVLAGPGEPSWSRLLSVVNGHGQGHGCLRPAKGGLAKASLLALKVPSPALAGCGPVLALAKPGPQLAGPRNGLARLGPGSGWNGFGRVLDVADLVWLAFLVRAVSWSGMPGLV